MRKILLFALLAVCCGGALAQDSVGSGWTDKNNSEMYAAYILRIAYYERGYMAANVTVSRSGTQDVFSVEPGPIYHFKNVSVVGLPENYVGSVMQDAPKAGEVYSAARVNDWLAQVKQKAGNEGRTLKIVHRETNLDHATATANVIITFE